MCIHSSADGHLDFLFWVILNTSTMNIDTQGFCLNICFHFSLLDIYLWVELLDYVVTQFSHFEGPLYCFPNRLHHFAIQLAVVLQPFPTSSPTLVIVCLFLFSSASGYKEASHCGISLIAVDGSIFSYLSAYWDTFFGDISVQILCPCFN